MKKIFHQPLALILILCAAVMLPSCTLFPLQSSPTPTLIPTSVPLATWIAQGVPDDTVIKYYSKNSLTGRTTSVTVHADGTVESAKTHLDMSARGTGQISQEELKRILIELAEIDFFSLAVDEGRCVYNVRYPPAEGSTKIYALDMSSVSIYLAMHGETNSISYYEGCIYNDYNFNFPMRLSDRLSELGRFAGEPVEPIMGTPISSPVP